VARLFKTRCLVSTRPALGRAVHRVHRQTRPSTGLLNQRELQGLKFAPELKRTLV
jgi:hypothetical protein